MLISLGAPPRSCAVRSALVAGALMLAALVCPASSAAAASGPAVTPGPRLQTPSGQPVDVQRPFVGVWVPLVYGESRNLELVATPNSTIDVYAVTLPDREFRVIDSALTDDLGLGQFTLPGLTGTTLLFAQDRERGLYSPPLTLGVRRAVSLEVTPAGDRNRFAGSINPPQAGVPVTLARIGVNGRLTGLLGTTTDTTGQYSFVAPLDDENGPLTVLTGTAGGIPGGRSQAFGRPWPRVPTVSLSVAREPAGTYRFSGVVSPGQSVSVSLARLQNGQRIGVVGGRTDASGRYTLRVRLAAGSYTFQVVTGLTPAFSWGLSQQYGLQVP